MRRLIWWLVLVLALVVIALMVLVPTPKIQDAAPLACRWLLFGCST